jgi:predicted transcriptional regulator
MTDARKTDLLALTAEIVAAHAAATPVPTAELAKLIQDVHRTLLELDGGPGNRTPAVAVKKSVTADYIVCLEDGKKLKMLKRHLQSAYGLTPEQYRQRWSLPPDYPMTAPNYAKTRSSLAKKSGLGTKSPRSK